MKMMTGARTTILAVPLTIAALHTSHPDCDRIDARSDEAGASSMAELSQGAIASAAPAHARHTHPRGAVGLASYYGEAFDGSLTASGVPFDPDALVAAHPTYPFRTVIRVTNLANGRSVRVRVVDRGPGNGAQTDGVIVDLSRRAFRKIAPLGEGRIRVRLKVLRWGEE
jgi:rare lipoprotein A